MQNDNLLKQYLESLLAKQLQQIYTIFDIYYGGTKPKLINKIIYYTKLSSIIFDFIGIHLN